MSWEGISTLDSRRDLRFLECVAGDVGGDVTVIVLMQGGNAGCRIGNRVVEVQVQ